MFEQKVRVGMGHIDMQSRLKLGAAVDFLQNASWFQMDTEKKLLGYFAEHGLNMYLVARQVDIYRFPSYAEELTLKAWIYGCDKYYGLRNTIMYDAAGEVCMATAARGAFIDLTSVRMVKISDEAAALADCEPPYPMEQLPRKIAVPKVEPQELAPVQVCSYHLDCFKHMNNARYVDIASGCLPDGFKPRRVRMEYKRAATLGKLITPHLYVAGPGELVITLDGDEGCYCGLEFVGEMH